MELFTIGDSVSQGFMSLAAARSDLCYSTLLARALDIKGYEYVAYPQGGLLVPLEPVLRSLNRQFGSDIRGIEWPFAIAEANRVLDKSEDYYEREAGRDDLPNSPPPTANYVSNVAAYGFTVADAWLVDGALCADYIKRANAKSHLKDGLIANAAFYRSAQRVLDPRRSAPKMSQLDWLEHHAAAPKGIKRTCLWLGANNALGTVINLSITQTPNDPTRRPHTLTHAQRDDEGWNLWHPADFAAEFDVLMERVDAAMANNSDPDWNVFLGTIPEVTIAPLAKGVGPWQQIDGKYWYAKYYTYFPFEEEFAKESGLHLTLDEALHIDRVIQAYNEHIHACAAKYNAEHHGGVERYVVVDIAQTLRELAHKRNGGHPTYKLPAAFKHRYPTVNTKYYHADAKGRLRQGGIVSLDGIHPSAIGQGLIAHEFLNAMKAAQVGDVTHSPGTAAELDWDAIFASDALYQRPISLMKEVYQHERLAQWIVDSIQLLRD